MWFILPCLLVITNDIFAYIFGISFGKTKLIELSPKKTWEGFIGGSVSTLAIAFIVLPIHSMKLANVLQHYSQVTCPQYEL